MDSCRPPAPGRRGDLARGGVEHATGAAMATMVVAPPRRGGTRARHLHTYRPQRAFRRLPPHIPASASAGPADGFDWIRRSPTRPPTRRRMHDTGGIGRAAVDLAEALIVALEEACSRSAHRWLLPYLGMARAELAQCRPGGPGRAVRVHEARWTSVHDGLEDLESLLTRSCRAHRTRTTLRLVSARSLVREGLQPGRLCSRLGRATRASRHRSTAAAVRSPASGSPSRSWSHRRPGPGCPPAHPNPSAGHVRGSRGGGGAGTESVARAGRDTRPTATW